jgi:hypothetical protein
VCSGSSFAENFALYLLFLRRHTPWQSSQSTFSKELNKSQATPHLDAMNTLGDFQLMNKEIISPKKHSTFEKVDASSAMHKVHISN